MVITDEHGNVMAWQLMFIYSMIDGRWMMHRRFGVKRGEVSAMPSDGDDGAGRSDDRLWFERQSSYRGSSLPFHTVHLLCMITESLSYRTLP